MKKIPSSTAKMQKFPASRNVALQFNAMRNYKSIRILQLNGSCKKVLVHFLKLELLIGGVSLFSLQFNLFVVYSDNYQHLK